MTNFQARQGDVFIEEVTNMPEGLEAIVPDNGGAVLAYGEVTGHKHQVEARKVEFFNDAANDNSYLRVIEPDTFVRHEEHTRIPLKPSIYRVRRQEEYDDSEEIRYVAD